MLSAISNEMAESMYIVQNSRKDDFTFYEALQ